MWTVWNNFFFRPKATEGIAIFRVLWCLLLLIVLLFDISNLNDFYGPHGLLSLLTVKEQFPDFHVNVFHLFGPSYGVVYFLCAVYFVALIFSLFGFYTRISLIIVFVCLTSFHQRNIWLLGQTELLMRLVTLYLLFSPCAHSFSIDSLLGRNDQTYDKPRFWAPWALRLIQFQVTTIYFWSVWNGYQSGVVWPLLLLQLGIGILVWIEKCRRPVILLGFIFHLGHEFVADTPFLGIFMMVLLLNFYTPEEHKRFLFNVRARLVKRLKAQESSGNWPLKKIIWAAQREE